ncbi:MAG: proline--tRNA ligase [Bacteriovoracaceae bacterium]|nr:proline--tRNA ligase [Bacteriovoracaceae bacterium]
MKHALPVTRQENFNEWYQQVIRLGDLAENSAVRGCMIIRPHGLAIWERMQQELDRRFKAAGVKNAYFPLLIPLSSLEKEAQHVEGFAKECAVVTHHRLIQKDHKLVPDGALEEPFVIRPTSEMIIGESFARWINSYRDLPLKVNQWANVMRWEMRPRAFLRTSEFLWQEGHTAHRTKEEALAMAQTMLHVYRQFCEEVLAIPVLAGEKTNSEKFPGADITYTIEGLMQDGKALQMGTSHFLGQNFATAQNIKFKDEDGSDKLVWTTSWGVSTRLIGALIMSHGDDDGMRIPPAIAGTQVRILPIIRQAEDEAPLKEYLAKLENILQQQNFAGQPLRTEIAWHDGRGGNKFWDSVRQGHPIILEVGPRDVAAQTIALSRRDQITAKKQFLKLEELTKIPAMLTEIQNNLRQAVADRLAHAIQTLSTPEDLQRFLQERPGMGRAYLADNAQVQEVLAQHKMSFRCIEQGQTPNPQGKCLISGEPVPYQVVIAQSY